MKYWCCFFLTHCQAIYCKIVSEEVICFQIMDTDYD